MENEDHIFDPLWKKKWNGINTRTKSDPYYKDRIHNEFSDWSEFRSWCLNTPYASGNVIDRIHPSGNYSPDNCQFLSVQDHRIKTAQEHRSFSAAQIREIRTLRDDGVSIQDLAVRFGCSTRHIYRIINGESYKDIK